MSSDDEGRPLPPPLMREITSIVHDLGRVGRALNALESLSTSGNPAQTDLSVLKSEDLGALFGALGALTVTKAAALEDALNQARQTTKRT